MTWEKSCGAVVFTRENGQVKYLLVANLEGIYGFPKGHVEAGETEVETALREVREETGLTIENPRLCGVKQFQTKENARYVVFFYKADQYHGHLQSSDEGEVFWLRRSEFDRYSFVEDFADMLKVFEQDDLNEFYYYKENGNWRLKLL